MSNLKLLGALLLTVGGTTQLLYAEQPSVIINSNIVQQKSTCSGVVTRLFHLSLDKGT